MVDAHVETMKQIPLFQGLTGRDLKALAKQAREDTHKPGEEIVRQGDPGGRLFVIADGTAKLVIDGKTKKRLGSGALIGELSLFDRGPRSATVVAESSVRTVSLTGAACASLFQENWTATRMVLATLATRLRAADKGVL